MNNIPITYIKNFIENPNEIFNILWNELDWKRFDLVPRKEYYCNEHNADYTYGLKEYARVYKSQLFHKEIINIQNKLNNICKILGDNNKIFDVCFLNGYEDSKDHLGWHADDSPEMDHNRPIAIISLGAEREIWFKEKDSSNDKDNITKILLQNGSLCMMQPGMQKTHLHRIPKCDNQNIGKRISLTFRGFVK